MNNKYLNYILENFKNEIDDKNKKIAIKINNIYIYIYIANDKWEIKDFKNFGRKTIFNLRNEENWSVLILILKLFSKGYTKDEIYLEKGFLVGHDQKYLDVAIYNKTKPFAFIEVKNNDEYKKYIDFEQHQKDTLQLFSYIHQNKSVEIGSFYTFDCDNETDLFSNVYLNDVLRKSVSLDDLFDNWDKNWNGESIFEWDKFNIKLQPLRYRDLKSLDKNHVKIIFNQFLTILRQNSVSDKSNAFDKLINIFLVKVIDERYETSTFGVNGIVIKDSLQFQFIENLDDNLSFLKRINNLYKDGMKEFMNKDIIDYKDDEIDKILSKNSNSQIRMIIDNLRLKKNNAFAFIEVFDDKTFDQNSLILKEIVKLFQPYKFKYQNKFQYLGDFFEELLNTAWKQESGQFFTPMPIVDFMINALPIEEKLIGNINNVKQDFIPKMIDYACGSGHFLISYMDFVQNCLQRIENVKPAIYQKLHLYKNFPFSWANQNVCGIEKDYRLSKTTKISGFLNGDGEAQIINGDGINKFNSNEYEGTLLFTNDQKNEKFDFVIANPPYSVDGFMKNIKNNGISTNDFTLVGNMKDNSSKIEILFVERAWQLLKNEGFACIILPQSIYTTSDYSKMRNFILNKFQIHCLVELGDQTFSGTTTSPVILFLQKKHNINLNYKILLIDSPKMLFEGSKKEKEFLGYEFSNNKYKLGIDILNNNLEKKFSPIVKEFIKNPNIDNTKLNKYIKIKTVDNILQKDENNNILIYTRRNLHIGNNWKTLSQLGIKVNPTYESIDTSVLKYIEIGDIRNGKIKINQAKNKQSARVCKKGDIIFSSLTPSKEKIAISDNTYKLSTAIFVLHSNNKTLIKKIYKYFKTQKNIYEDMSAFLDGFKITYAKINEFNLSNNIYLDTSKF